MGQKVHPIGFRVGITKRHQSQWFARFTKNAYAQSILEDRMLRNTLISFANEALNSSTVQKRAASQGASPSQQSLDTPKITHIKIERGLIPYEISIAIYAENCQKFKASLNNLKIHLSQVKPLENKKSKAFSNELQCKLQKTRRFLISLGKHSSVSSLVATQLPLALNQTSGALTNLEVSLNEKQVLALSKTNSLNNSAKNQNIFFLNSLGAKSRPNVTSSFMSNKQGTGKQQQFRKPLLSQGKLSSQTQKKVFSSDFLSHVNKKKKMILKRLRKRQEIRRRYRRLMLKGLFVQKKGKVISFKPSFFFSKKKRLGLASGSQKFSLKARFTNQPTVGRSSNGLNFKKRTLKGASTVFETSRVSKKGTGNPVLNKGLALTQRYTEGRISGLVKAKKNDQSQIGNRIKKKFVSLFLNKNNKRFLKQLKNHMTLWHTKMQLHRQEQIQIYGSLRFAPLGYNQKWSLKRLNFLKSKPLFKLIKLVDIIEKKSLIKLETLRKDFIAFGTIAKGEALNYYQIINFLKNLKIASKKQSFLLLNSFKNNKIALKRSEGSLLVNKLAHRDNAKEMVLNATKERSSALVYRGSEHALERMTYNETINDECRKINFIEYLKDIVKKHRTQNLYYYLSTISDARKNLKKIQQFTKLHSNFLFGFDFKKEQVEGKNPLKGTIQKNFYSKAIKKVIDSSSKKTDVEKGLPEIFLEQIEKQRTMYKQLAELNPKITIKFYSVKSENLKAKASTISDSVIDALEKRKAFRKVVKDAKENLMRSSNVKGVKIQVSGRLNGAEIARTEWVRAGRVPLQTLRANIDYSYKTAKTIYGIIGVKVWIFKGYTKLV